MPVIFVFGSNLKGIHGKGAALFARNHYGAQLGVGRGRTGNAYALPTKDENLVPRSLAEIDADIDIFVEYAWENRSNLFLLSPFGCGYAGYTAQQIAALLKRKDLPSNIVLTKHWLEHF